MDAITGFIHGTGYHHEADPIHITIDVNVKADRKRKEFFGKVVDTAEEELDIDKALKERI